MGRVIIAGLVVVCVSAACLPGQVACGNEVSLVGAGFDPNSGQEITVYIHTDIPLLCMGIVGMVSGDATVTGAMNESDSGDYGWDPGWTGDPYIDDANGWVSLCGVSWARDANDIVGYFTFIYHGGQVVVSMIGDAYDFNCDAVPLSEDTITFGQPDPNMNMSLGNSLTTDSLELTLGEEAALLSAETYVELSPAQEYFQYLRPAAGYAPIEGGDSAVFAMEGEMGALSIVIDANTVMTENTVWDEDVTLNGTVYVEGAMLVIMPGVSVYNATDTGGIVVRNGGAIVASGTNEYRVGFTAASAQPYQDEYPFAIKIEESASPACVIYNCVVMFAERGIWIDNARLEKPIEQMTIVKCSTGIYQEGPALTDIVNSEMINCVWAGMDIYLTDANDPNNTCSADTFIAIEHNTIVGYYIDGIWGQQFGIMVHGSPDANAVGSVVMADNIITGSFYYAVVMGDGYINCDGRYNHGYFNNWEIDTGDPWGDIDPKIVYQSPFCFGTWNWPYLLKPDSPFVDGGVANVEQFPYLIGLSTYMGFPDVNTADIGIHYNREGFVNVGVNPLFADFNNDLGVDANDLLIFTDHWLEDGNSPTYDPNVNFDDEDLIDFRDFAVLASEWKMRTNPFPPDIAPTFDQDPNNLRGNVTISIPVYDGVRRTVLLLDGKRITEFGSIWSEPVAIVATREYANGWHKMKLALVCEDAVFITSPVNVYFRNELSLVNSPITYTPGRDLCYYGLSDPNVYDFKVYDMSGVLVFEQTCEDGIAVCVPGTVLSDEYGAYRFVVPESNEVVPYGLKSSPSPWPWPSPKIDKVKPRTITRDDPAIQNAQILITIGSADVEVTAEPFWLSVLGAAAHRKMKPILLTSDICTWDNIQVCLSIPTVKIWYHVGHGGSQVTPKTPERQFIEVGTKLVFSYLKGDLGAPPAGEYQDMGRYEKMGSVARLPDPAARKLIWVQFDTCDSGKNNEFPRYLRMLTDGGGPLGDKIFIGWFDDIWFRNANIRYDLFEPKYWVALAYGSWLNQALEDGTWGIPGGLDIMANFRYYGVVDLQYARFRYEGIN